MSERSRRLVRDVESLEAACRELEDATTKVS